MSDLCEYNRTLNQASFGGQEDGDCPNVATVSLGSGIGKNWHLCEACAALPRFRRFRRRVPLRQAKGGEG